MIRPAPLLVAARLVLPAILGLVTAAPASAHWCDCLWASSYNLVVRPETDEVMVPGGGSTTLAIWVQNNMGYPLVNFSLDAWANGYDISVSRSTPAVNNYLMPSERLRHTLTISRADGATLYADEIEFSVAFGNGVQDNTYPSAGEAVMIRLNDGSLAPESARGLGDAGGQAMHLGAAAVADFGSTDQGVEDLLQEFCVGRGSYSSNSSSIIRDGHCPSPSSTTCADNVSRGHTKYDYQHLWAAEFLAARKNGMSAQQIATLRERLMCAYNDDHFTFQAFSALLLGYLGEDAGARSFLEDKIASGSSEEQNVAKAALLMLGRQSDYDSYGADVEAGLSSGNAFVACACAASLGIARGDDSAVQGVLFQRARWVQPDTGDNGLGFYAGHLLDLVSWHRRGWAPLAGDEGSVSFYGEEADDVPPAAPGGVSCTPLDHGQARVEWSQVTQDRDGGDETVTQYRVYWGTTARPSGVTGLGEQGFDYDHGGSTGSIYYVAEGLAEGETYHFAVTAIDASSNPSVYSAEVSCAIAETNDPPAADLSCAPLSGEAPLEVTCDGTGSSDPDGASDLASLLFSLDGAAEVEDGDGVVAYSFDAPGSHTVTLRVVDLDGLDDTATATIQALAPEGENQPPVAAVTASPEAGDAPLEVSLDASESTDPDGDGLTYSWNFDDGSAGSTDRDPTHTFETVGAYAVTLTVTDDGAPPLSGVSVVNILVTEATNSAPVVSSVSASPLYGPAPLTVHLDATGVYDPEDDAVELTWDLGDGSSETSAQSLDHTYDTEGTYEVILTAQDDGTPEQPPAERSFAISVTDNLPPDAGPATVSPLEGGVPLMLTLDATGSSDPDGDEISFYWEVVYEFDDPEIYTEALAQHRCDASGTYEVSLTLTDDADIPIQVTRRFSVEVVEGSGEAEILLVSLSEGFSCAAQTGAVPGALGVVALGLLFAAVRRRR